MQSPWPYGEEFKQTRKNFTEKVVKGGLAAYNHRISVKKWSTETAGFKFPSIQLRRNYLIKRKMKT